jgi:hypothetical protein
MSDLSSAQGHGVKNGIGMKTNEHYWCEPEEHHRPKMQKKISQTKDE